MRKVQRFGLGLLLFILAAVPAWGQVQTQTASMRGVKTFKVADAGALASATFKSLMVAAGVTTEELKNIKHADIEVVTGPIYFDVEGETADADDMRFATDYKWEIRNCRDLLVNQLTVYASGAHDIRVAVYE